MGLRGPFGGRRAGGRRGRPRRLRHGFRAPEGRLVAEGDATRDETLEGARVEHATTAIRALSSGAANVFDTLSTCVLNPKLRIISRYDHPETREKLLRAGADQVVSPMLMGGRRVVNCVLRPKATQLMDKVLHGRGLDLRMDEFLVLDDSPLIGTPLAERNLREQHGLLIVAIRHTRGAWLHAPGPEVKLEDGETVVVIGQDEGVGKILRGEGSGLRPAGGEESAPGVGTTARRPLRVP